MTLAAELDLPAFDYTDPEMRGERFHRTMQELRGQGWLASGPFGFFALDRESVEFFLRTRSATFPGMTMAELFGVTGGPLYEQIRLNLLNINGEDHRRLRNLINPALSPRAVERYRPAMRAFLGQLLAEVVTDGRCDFVAAFARPYPALVIASVMGAPLEDAERLHLWSNLIQRQFDAASMMSDREPIEQAVREFYLYTEELLELRHRQPGDDLVSMLIAAEDAGDRLSDVELINMVFNVLVGGVDTSQSQLAHAIRLFATHPEQWELLRADPGLAPAAVEEVLRVEPITPFTARIMLEDVEFRDVLFPAGTVVMVSAFTGNREDEPGGFDITAERGAGRALTFGAGIHYCLGANLARAELQEGLVFLSQNLERLALDGEPAYESITGIYGLAELPISFAASAPTG